MSDEELSAIESQIARVILENRQLRAQNAELHRRLIAQIAQNGQLIRQGRKLDGERPEYVTVPDKGVTGGYRPVAIVPDWCSVLAFMPADVSS